jgi:UDP-N-acetylglucosamine:LPS N-acetylglucosamine transferase
MHPKLTETLSKYNKIVLVGGGTGGHIQPIISLIQSYQLTNSPTHQPTTFLWIGGKDSNEEKEAKNA